LETHVNDLPGALKSIKTQVGLHFLSNAANPLLRYPIAAGRLPLPSSPDKYAMLPLQTNFMAATLDLNKPEDLLEYQNIMAYAASDYGMRIVNLERKYITKRKRINGKLRKKLIKRIYIEYYAPYRVIPPNVEL
jgi:hypothetical protein